MANVLLLPGFLGSELYASPGFPWPQRRLWPPNLAFFWGDIPLTQLGADGLSPGPASGGAPVVAGGPVAAVYGPLYSLLTALGHRVVFRGWDWRMDLIQQGAAIWGRLGPLLGGQRISLVAHSAGGLVAAAVYGAALSAGQGAQIARVVTMGTPFFGSWSAVLAWWGMAPGYHAVQALQGWPGDFSAGPDALDAAVASWPALYQLQPFRNFGPLAQQQPDQAAAIYSAAWYQGANPHLQSQWWVRAAAAQAQLVGWTLPAITTSIVGVGTPTVAALAFGPGPVGPPAALVTQDGDGVVTVAQASPVAVPVVAVPFPHSLLPLAPAVWAAVLSALGV